MKSTDPSVLERFVEFGQRRFGTEAGWKAKYAQALEMTPQQLSDILALRSPIGPRIREKLHDLLQCDINWLMTGKTPGIGKKKQIEFIEEGLVRIPVFEYARAGSKTMMLAEKPSYYISSTHSTDDSRFGIVVKGKSMEPEIREGEVIVVSRKKDVKNGDVCLVIFEDGDACLRRVYSHAHGVTLTSANEKEYPPNLHKKSEIRTMYRMVQKITNY